MTEISRTILGIESSCDECSAAVVRLQGEQMEVLSLKTQSQIKIHRPFGGVVPEIASRNHLENVNHVIAAATEGIDLKSLDGIAVTNRPGLIGALLVGVSAAKAMAYALKLPVIPVHHLEGHAASVFIDTPPSSFEFPLLLAIVSGGHTQLHVVKSPPQDWKDGFLKESLVGRSIDDAAGEAFDKTAKLMGYPYPGGVEIDRNSNGGDPARFSFPRALPKKTDFNFSFSGLKTAVSVQLQKMSESEIYHAKADLCASVQEAIVEVLWRKINLAMEKYQCQTLAVVGGVAANSRMRELLQSECSVPVHFPPMKYCTDNAAMIATVGAFKMDQDAITGPRMLELSASSQSGLL